MKKVTSLLLLAGVAAFGLVGCGDDVSVTQPQAQITSVSVSPAEVTLEAGQTATVTASVQTSGDAGQLSYSWSVADANVATVSGNGSTATVTGQSNGTTAVQVEVTATNVSGSQTAAAGVEVQEVQDATLSIGEITENNGDAVDVENVSGQINVAVNVDKGGEDVSQVSLLLDGEVVSTQDFASANIQSTTVRGQGQVEQIVFSFRTDRLEGSEPGNVITVGNASLDGNVKRGQFDNGDHEVSAQLTTAAGAVRSATNSQTLDFNNVNEAFVTHLSGGQGVVEPTSGARYWGGEDIEVAVTPVIFDGGVSAGSVTISANAGNQTGSGNGSIVFDSPTVSGEPFVFDILQEDNSGGIEDAQGAPDGLGGHGSDFDVSDIRDSSGATVLSAFTVVDLNDFFLDFDAPDQGGSVEFGGVTTTVPGGSVHYSGFEGTGTVPIILPGVSDDGVGGTFSAPSANFTIDIIDSSSPGSASTLFSDIGATWELPEQAPSGSGGATDHFAHVTDLADNLGNGLTYEGGGITVMTPVGDFGIDQTAVAESNQLPSAATGSSPTGFVFNADGSASGVLSVDLEDPALANGETPSGLNTGAVTITVEDQSENNLTGPTSAANPSGGTTWTDGGVVSGTPDGPQFAFIAHEDNAEPANGDSQAWTYIKDTTAPSFGALNPVPSSTSTGATSVILDIGGNVTDANAIASATVTVRADGSDAQGGGDGVCTTGDYLLDPGAGEIDQNEVDISNGTNEIDFSESFEISDPFTTGTGTVKYCFFVNAADEALDNTGSPAPNTDDIQTNADVEWTN